MGTHTNVIMEMSNEFRSKLAWMRSDSKYDVAIIKYIDADTSSKRWILRELGLKSGSSICAIHEAFVRFDAICSDFDNLVSKL